MTSLFKSLFLRRPFGLIVILFFSMVTQGEVIINQSLEQKVIEWRRHLHRHPELSNREFETAKYIAKHLKHLGLTVKTGVAHTGVVGLLKGTGNGPVVALRADMDALPVDEPSGLPFSSKKRVMYNGQNVGVMHACGHDTHVAILMGVAEYLSKNKHLINGSVKFIFQPAEEGSPEGEEGGAELMIKEGVLDNPRVDAIFGLHISSGTNINTVGYRAGGMMAAVDDFKVTIFGKQVHGSTPWNGIDPIVTAAQMINNIQTIVSRQLPLTIDPAVISIGSIHGGVRSNIIPDKVELIGTIRTFDPDMRTSLHQRLRNIVEHSAKVMGASAEILLPFSSSYPVTYNDYELTEKMLPTLQRVLGEKQVKEINPMTGAEDFSFFQKEIPGFYFFLGGKPLDVAEKDAPAHHTPSFYIDEAGLSSGVKLLSELTLDYIKLHSKQ